ncbi:hypothetical protein [Serratia sp. DD3]|uniref:hypothetical protein n=1 Tax=Serratia sp. DD3 TaxID=1410619 RepID=UPI0003C5064C|nr:hypothetical protein [Serratia sp. DD3]KEY56954.1 hypothetical protein SRDD_42030 [Serratia sp. DD3]
MSNYQRMIDQMLEQYESMLEKSPDEQNLIGDQVDREMKGLKLHGFRHAASALFPCADQKQLAAVMDSAWMDERLYDAQYEIVQRMVMLERTMLLSREKYHLRGAA